MTFHKKKESELDSNYEKISSFIDEPKNKKLIADFTKNINEFQEMATDVKDLLMKISNEARRQKLENFSEVEKLIKEIYKSVPEAFGFANKLMKLEKLLRA